ncbi:MAG: hypothetical protein UZ17_ACD001002637 [Acidobacteria bacterium OLB17]|nr:MAG: hypothetical protein UZ17_ACD001002637 [Acidobacteria bacterium OLB17]MCZ2390863.1 DoxX family protein [Acidobacteriota bacterium]
MTFELTRDLPLAFTALMTAILFVQSSLDKVADWSGNLEYLTSHFEKTPLGGFVPVMLITITVMELVTGVASVVGLAYLLATGSGIVLFYASIVGSAAICGLFFGQRIAKDYAGAAILIPYFLLLMLMMLLSLPARTGAIAGAL